MLLEKTLFETVNQVHKYLAAAGWKVAYNTIRKAIDDGKLKERRKGGYARRTVDQYARTFLAKKIDPTPEPEPELVGFSENLQAQKLKQQISGMEMKERREHFNFMRERGLYTETVTIDRELADRWMSLDLFLSSWLVTEADNILDMLGGNHEKSMELVRLVVGDELAADKLSQHMFSRRAELVNLFRTGVKEALNRFGRGQWFTEDMRVAWDEYERNREEVSLEAAENVLGNIWYYIQYGYHGRIVVTVLDYSKGGSVDDIFTSTI